MNATSRRRRAVPAVALVVGLSATVLSGCSELERGRTAATVNGSTISDDDVQQATRDLQAHGATQATPDKVLGLLVYGKLLDPIAAKYGKSVSASSVEQQSTQLRGAGPIALDVIRANAMLSANLQSDGPIAREFLDALKKADLTVNPRYGTVDSSQGRLAAAALPWIKQTAMAPQGADGAQG